MVPIQGHIDRPTGDQLDQLATGQFVRHLLFRHQAPAKAAQGQAHEALGRRTEVMQKAALDAVSIINAKLEEAKTALPYRQC